MGGAQPVTSFPLQDPSPSLPSYPTEKSTPPLSTPYTVAILPFETYHSPSIPTWLSHGLPELILSDLARWPSIEVISRKALGSVLREQWLQQRGFSDIQPVVELGAIKGVHYVIQGIMQSFDGSLTVDLQLVDVETGVVVGTMRSRGSETNIPQIERELVRQIILRFQLSGHPNASLGEVAKNSEGSSSTTIQNHPIASKKDFTNHSIHRIEAELSLERFTFHRQQALGFADALWRTGLRSEFGHSRVQSLGLSHSNPETHTLLTVPVAVFFEPNRIRDLEKDWEQGGWVSPLRMEKGRVHIPFPSPEDSVDTGSGRLLYERFVEPRRVFVRALSAQGQVLAVYSSGDWKMKWLSFDSEEDISVPLAPRAYVQGIAKFPIGWVSSGGEHVTFDALAVPVPMESTRVKLEVIRDHTHGDLGGKEESPDMKRWLSDLEGQIQADWSPEVLEGLPMGDYLPGNKRRGRLTLLLEKGTVAEVRIHSKSHDPLFKKGLLELQQHLQGLCVSCSLGADTKLLEGIEGFRVQLVHIKDIQALKLGGFLP